MPFFYIVRINGNASDTHAAAESLRAAWELAAPDAGDKVEWSATDAPDAGAARLANPGNWQPIPNPLLPEEYDGRSTFEACGFTFRLHRLQMRRKEWSLFKDGVARCRFGNRNQITDDVFYCLEAGTLPPAPLHPW